MSGLSRDDPRHGTENGYGNLGCRCARCTRAHADYRWRGDYSGTPRRDAIRNKKYAQARRAGYNAEESRRRAHRADPLA